MPGCRFFAAVAAGLLGCAAASGKIGAVPRNAATLDGGGLDSVIAGAFVVPALPGVIDDKEGLCRETQIAVDDRVVLSAVETGSATITKAVQSAEQHARGKIIVVELEEAEDGEAVWVVVLVVEGDACAAVDPASGGVRSK